MIDHKTLMQQALESLIESARLLGATQEKRSWTGYTKTDSMFEAACYEIIEAKKQNILEAIAQPAKSFDSTQKLKVGDTSFESWYSEYCYAHKSDKHRARDAYAAGMGDPLVTYAQPIETPEPDLKWCGSCGEGYAGFCRAKSLQERCPMTQPVPPTEPMAYAVYWGIGEMKKDSVHFERKTAEDVAAQIKSITEVRPLFAIAQPVKPALYQFQSKDGTWCYFTDERHYKNTVADGRWPIRALYEHPTTAQPAQPATDKLLQIIAATYQIAGACDAPFHILDVLANPEMATQEQIDAMLPFVPMQPVLPLCTWHELNDADRQKAFGSLPDMLDGFLKTWGWLHFAKAIEAKCREKNIAQPAVKHNFCPRCGKRLGGTDDIHTCTAPVDPKETK